MSDRFGSSRAPHPLWGLVLSGGQSRRMGQDKGRLRYRGSPQIFETARLLAPFTAAVAISVRPAQYRREELEPFMVIEDRLLDWGPLGAILSAQLSFPEVSWLVVACDMPSLNPSFLEELLAARQPLEDATVPRHAEGLEPLAAIYEARFMRRALDFVRRGILGPRRILEESRIATFCPSAPELLKSINTPEDRRAWLAQNSLTASHPD